MFKCVKSISIYANILRSSECCFWKKRCVFGHVRIVLSLTKWSWWSRYLSNPAALQSKTKMSSFFFSNPNITFSRRFCQKRLTVIQTYIYSLTVVAAMQGTYQHIGSSLRFSMLPKDTLTSRPGELNQQPSDNGTLALLLSYSRPKWSFFFLLQKPNYAISTAFTQHTTESWT